jgi:hypothetical protein
MLLAHIDRRNDVDGEIELGTQPAQGLDVTAPPPTESVVVPDHQLAHAAVPDQHLPHELLGVHRREPAVEVQDDDPVDRRLRHHLEPLARRREPRRRRLRVHHLERVRLEGHQHARQPGRPGPLRDLGQHRLVAEVHAIE